MYLHWISLWPPNVSGERRAKDGASSRNQRVRASARTDCYVLFRFVKYFHTSVTSNANEIAIETDKTTK